MIWFVVFKKTYDIGDILTKSPIWSVTLTILIVDINKYFFYPIKRFILLLFIYLFNFNFIG